ncbi:MAG: DoxX family protein [Kineosporiaceae bacterium]
MSQRTGTPVPTSRAREISAWTPQIVLAAALVGGGTAKLVGDPAMTGLFADIGAGQWFRIAVGALEVTGGIGLLLPRLRAPAALGLLALLLCAAATNVLVLDTSPASPLAFAAVATAVLVMRRHELRAFGRPPGRAG